VETRCSPRCECYQNASRRENNTSVVMILRALGRPVSYFPGVDTWFGSTGQLRPESRQRVGKAAQLLAEGEPRLATVVDEIGYLPISRTGRCSSFI